ncbi:MAG: hypothetical protein MJK12_03870 [Colwellia sp.]|nr:hypothetical protein [Colwellia sp.]
MKNMKIKAMGAVAALTTSAASFAVDHATAITAAGTDGTANTTAAVVVVIGIAAVVTGVGIVLSLLKR